MADAAKTENDGVTRSARRVYFDAQQWNYFAEPETGPHPESAVKRVRRAQQDRLAAVVGSLDLLQELIEARRGAPRKAARMLDLFFQLVGDRLLLPLNERHPEEALAGGVLSQADQYVSRDVRKDVRRFAQSGRHASELIEDLCQQKVAFRESEQRLQQQMIDRLAEEVPVKQAPLMRDWIATVDINEWVRGVADDPRLRVRVPDYEGGPPEHLPSASAFVIARLGRLVRTMGERRKIQGSDLADAQHVACGPYIDVLVTDDEELRATLDPVRDRLSFEYMSSEDFFATLP